jgi:hypothetical protein
MTNNKSHSRREHRLLVFSNKQPGQIKSHRHNIKRRDLEIDIVGNTPAMIAKLNLNKYRLCLIDFEIINNGSQILEIIRILANYNIPVLIRKIETLPTKDTIGLANIRDNDNPIKAEENTLVFNYPDADSPDESRLINLLTATINHAVNSPLMAISANVEMILNDLSPSEKPGLKSKIAEIGLAAKKIETVLKKLRESENHRYKQTPAGFMIDVPTVDDETERKRPKTAVPVS